MKAKKIRLNPFDPSSVQSALAEVKAFQSDFGSKLKKFRDEVAVELAALAEVEFNGAGYDDVLSGGTRVPNVVVDVVERGDKDIVVALGKEAVFAEFGAGVYYNGPVGSSPHPWGPKNLFYIGTYGKGYGARKVWGYYDEGGDLKLTHGTPASMPLYHATQDVIGKIKEIAQRVFGEGDAG